jgi:hypothetical protein
VARSLRQERVSTVFEGWEAVSRWTAFTGLIVRPGLLLVARIWLSQAIFVHQIMMMMHGTGFSEAPPVEAMLIRSVTPLLLASGLATRPVALLLLVGVGQDASEAHLAGDGGLSHRLGATLVGNHFSFRSGYFSLFVLKH